MKSIRRHYECICLSESLALDKAREVFKQKGAKDADHLVLSFLSGCDLFILEEGTVRVSTLAEWEAHQKTHKHLYIKA